MRVKILLPMLFAGACLPAVAQAASPAMPPAVAQHFHRAQTLAAAYEAKGMEPQKAFSLAWAALCAEQAGRGSAEELMAAMVLRTDAEEVLAELSAEDYEALMLALKELEADTARSGATLSSILRNWLSGFRNEDVAASLAQAAGTGGAATSFSGASAAAASSVPSVMPSVWWLQNHSGSLLQYEAVTEPFMPSLSREDVIVWEEGEPSAPPETQNQEEEQTSLLSLADSGATSAAPPAPFSAGVMAMGFSGGGMMMRMAPMLLALPEEPPVIEVGAGTSQSVVSPTSVSAITLADEATLYVSDTLTLQAGSTMTVTDSSHLVVKEGGVVRLGAYQDYYNVPNSAELNRRTAILFNALLNSTETEGSGVVEIDSVSVQFGDGTSYNLIGPKNVNATFAAHYEIGGQLQLQNYNQGAVAKQPSLWKIAENAFVHVGGDMSLSSYQQMDVEGGRLVVDGGVTLGHTAGADYAAKLTIAEGSYVQLKQIGDARTENDGQSQLVMTGGELVFTVDGNAVSHTLGAVTLESGALVADGHSWILNNDATVGSANGLLIRTDADHSVTLGTAATTTTLGGRVEVAQGSHAVLNGLYTGTGTVMAEAGSTLTLGPNFSTVPGSSVGLAGTGAVLVSWEGVPGALRDGFAESYDISYRPVGLAGELNLAEASQLLWRDAAGNTLRDVAYENGVLTGRVIADPTVYHIVTSGHTAVVDAGGAAEKAASFQLYNDGKLFIGKGYSVAAAQVAQKDYTLTLQGGGDYVLGGYTLPGKTAFEQSGDAAWTGAVVLSGTVGGNKVVDFTPFYRQGSAIAMAGFDGISEEWSGGTLSADIRLDAQQNGEPAWRWNSGSQSSAYTVTFSGRWSGEGDFVLGAEGSPSWLQNVTYSGDISDWTGRFYVEKAVSDVRLTGDTKNVYAELDKGEKGILNLRVDTDTVFHADAVVSSLAVANNKKVWLDKGTEMHITNALLSGTSLQQHLQSDYFSRVSGEGTLFLNFGTSTYDQMSITAGQTVTPDVNVVFTGEGRKQDLSIAMWGASSGGLKLDHTFWVADEMTLQWGAGLSVGQTETGAGSLLLNKLHLGHSDNNNKPARADLSGGTMMLGGIDISSSHSNTFTMTGGVLEITSSGNALTKSAAGADNTVFTLAGGALRADGTRWVFNHNAVIGEKDGSTLAVESLNGGAVTIGAQGITTTLANTIDNHGTLTLDGTVNIIMAASDKANGYVDQEGNFGMSVGFAATLQMPGAATYQVVTGNAASLGTDIAWKADGQTLNVVPAGTQNAADNSYYFDGYNLRLVNEKTDADPERVGTVYYVGGRGGDYSFDKAENAAIVTGFDIANGTLHVDVSPEHNVSLVLGYGTLAMGKDVKLTVDEPSGWSMDAGASVVLDAGAVLTLPGVEPETKADSYKVYQLLNNASGSGTIVFDGTLDVQFGNAGHNFVSPDSYNILEDNGTADTGLNADIKTNVVVKGDMLIQNYRQGKDHPEAGSWWKVSEGGSLRVEGDLESSSYQKVSVEGGALTVGGTYKIGHEAGGEYEGDLELKSGSLSVGTFETVHEGTSTVHITGGKLTVTGEDKTAFANTFREVSARNAEFEGNWIWNHNATIGNITVTAGSAITIGTADTEITLASPLAANNGSLELDGAFVVNMEATEGGDVYGTDATGYTKEGDGYLKNLGDVYTLVAAGNNATLGKDIMFTLNGEVLRAGDFEWNGKSILLNATEAGTVFYLHTDNGYTYTAADTRTTAFELRNAGATLRLERELAGLEAIRATAGGTVSLGSSVRMDSALLQAEETVTMAGEGTYVLSSNALMAHPAAHRVCLTEAAWAGTVEMSGMLGTEGSLNSLGNAHSLVEFKGVFGADNAEETHINIALTDTPAAAAWIYTGNGSDVAFRGDWSGDGTFIFAPVGGVAQKLEYSGDLSAWHGTFSAQGGTAQLCFSGSGGNVVSADMAQQGGRIELTAETDTHFAGATGAAAYIAAGGNLEADAADAAAIDTLCASGGDVTLEGLEAAVSLHVQELLIGDERTVALRTQEERAAEVILGEGARLSAGQASTLSAGLSLENGCEISIEDRRHGLALQGALSLGGEDIRLDEDMKLYLAEHSRLVLFSGLTELQLSDGTVIRGPLSSVDGIEAETYFSGLIERLNAQGKGEKYYITYSGSAEGGVLCIETPEPSGTVLSLLALLGVVLRRRR